MKTKLYKARSSARRAAKGTSGFNMETVQILQNEDGLWYATDTVLEEAAVEEKVEAEAPEIKAPPAPTFDAGGKGVCAFIWNTAETMVGARRKEVVDYCVECGVNRNTARTQYQKWFTATKTRRLS